MYFTQGRRCALPWAVLIRPVGAAKNQDTSGVLPVENLACNPEPVVYANYYIQTEGVWTIAGPPFPGTNPIFLFLGPYSESWNLCRQTRRIFVQPHFPRVWRKTRTDQRM